MLPELSSSGDNLAFILHRVAPFRLFQYFGARASARPYTGHIESRAITVHGYHLILKMKKDVPKAVQDIADFDLSITKC